MSYIDFIFIGDVNKYLSPKDKNNVIAVLSAGLTENTLKKINYNFNSSGEKISIFADKIQDIRIDQKISEIFNQPVGAKISMNIINYDISQTSLIHRLMNTNAEQHHISNYEVKLKEKKAELFLEFNLPNIAININNISNISPDKMEKMYDKRTLDQQ